MASIRQVGQVKHNARKLLTVQLSCTIILLGDLKVYFHLWSFEYLYLITGKKVFKVFLLSSTSHQKNFQSNLFWSYRIHMKFNSVDQLLQAFFSFPNMFVLKCTLGFCISPLYDFRPVDTWGVRVGRTAVYCSCIELKKIFNYH